MATSIPFYQTEEGGGSVAGDRGLAEVTCVLLGRRGSFAGEEKQKKELIGTMAIAVICDLVEG